MGVELRQPWEGARPEGAGVVDQQVDVAKFLDESLPMRRVGDIPDDGSNAGRQADDRRIEYRPAPTRDGDVPSSKAELGGQSHTQAL